MDDSLGKSNYKVKLPSVAFLICFLIAFVAWAIINFSKEYTVTMDYRVACENLPANKQSVTLSDSVLMMTFRARGVHFLHPRYNDRNRIIHLSVNQLIKNNSKRNVYTFTKKALGDFVKTDPVFQEDFVGIESPESLTIYLK